jgi:hypothetical protein
MIMYLSTSIGYDKWVQMHCLSIQIVALEKNKNGLINWWKVVGWLIVVLNLWIHITSMLPQLRG